MHDIVTLTSAAWRLDAPLATSRYGVLWRATNAATGVPAALKLVNTEEMRLAPAPLRRHWCDAAAAEIAFLRALQPWDGRHIVRLLDAGTADGCPALALELLDGDLKTLLATRGTPPFGQALDWIAQVNGALARVHQYGWRHLDLKPANLLVDAAAGTLKLADFGTCRPLADAGAHDVAGTPGWQAPEQCAPAMSARCVTDARSDYFALGALFYHLVTGARLATHDGIAPAEASLFLARASGAGHGAGAAALALLRTLTAPEPGDRPRHALDISRLLARVRDAAGGTGMRRAA